MRIISQPLFQASSEFVFFNNRHQSYQASVFGPKGLARRYSPTMRAEWRCKTAGCAGSIVLLKYITVEMGCPGHLLQTVRIFLYTPAVLVCYDGVCLCVCVYIYIHTHTHTHTHTTMERSLHSSRNKAVLTRYFLDVSEDWSASIFRVF